MSFIIDPKILTETYISTDVETNGPIPGPHSMLSFASAAYRISADGTRSIVSTFTANLETLPGAEGDADTMSFWAKNPEAFAATRTQTQPPQTAMRRYADWLLQFQRPVFVGYPASFDFLFMYWYLVKFTGFPTAFSFSALDVKTYAAAMLKSAYRDVSKKTMPRRWFDEGKPHTHVALDDALEQGELFCRMLLENLRRGSVGVKETSSENHKLDTNERVFFYEQDFYVLSNFSAFTLIWQGIRFDTSEAAYHWEKFPNDREVRFQIENASSAHEAFKIAEKHRVQRRVDWDSIKVDVMRRILRAKVAQHEYVRRKLLATGTRELVEDSWRDSFWGWGADQRGQNMLGKLWMEIRAELRSDEVSP